MTGFSGFSRQMTRILPIDCTGCAASRRQISFIQRARASRSSVAAFTLISSCAFSARSTSATMLSVRPLSPMKTTGLRGWACARSSLRRTESRAGMRGL
jgi:hypothetical protein